MNIISKKYKFELNTKDITPVKLKPQLQLFSSDSVIFDITVKEDGVIKDLTGCKVVLLSKLPSGKVVEQRDNVVYMNELEGNFKVQPMDSLVSESGSTMFNVVIFDDNESITLQPFIVKIIHALDREITEPATIQLNTIGEIQDLILKYMAELELIKLQSGQLQDDVDSSILEINRNIAELELNIRLLEHRVLGISNETTKLPNRIKLTPFDVQGSQYWYFSVDVKEQAITLLDKHFLLYMKGKLTTGNTANIHTCLASISFSGRYDSKGLMQIYPYTNIINDPIINNRSISPSVVFNQDLSGFVSASSVNNKLLIKSNILKSTYIGEMHCYLNNLGANNLLIN